MYKALTNTQMREADEYTIKNIGISSEELMRRAGIALADEVEKTAKKLSANDVLVVCETGNNGGDGYVCANELYKRDFNVKIFAAEGKLSPDCEREKSRAKSGFSHDISGAIIVDCLFGTGLSREITGQYREIIEKINLSHSYVISADIPSGINGDNGRVCGIAVKANLTVAIAEYKAGMFLNDGMDYCGNIVKKDIGIVTPEKNYAQIYTDEDIKKFFPLRKRNSHKGTYGTANIIAGCDKYMGAAALSSEAALMSGCGYVKLTTCEKAKLSLAPALPQVIFLDVIDLHANAYAIGMGCGVSKNLYDNIEKLIKNSKVPVLIDADGLNSIATYGEDILLKANCPVIITPHVKEFSRLTGLSVEEILNNPVEYAIKFAKQYKAIVLLKGAATVITDGEHTVINTRGTTALSKGGSGDMLAGFICGAVARGLSAFDGAVCGAYALGLSAEISSSEKTDYCATAKDILKNLHFSIKRLTE